MQIISRIANLMGDVLESLAIHTLLPPDLPVVAKDSQYHEYHVFDSICSQNSLYILHYSRIGMLCVLLLISL